MLKLGERILIDSYQLHLILWANSEPGPPGHLASQRILPCALSWNTKKVWCVKSNRTIEGIHKYQFTIFLSPYVSYNAHDNKFKPGYFVCGGCGGTQEPQNHKIQIRIKIFTLHFTDILWIMDYRWQFLHFHTLSVEFQHPHLYWKLHSLCSAQQQKHKCWYKPQFSLTAFALFLKGTDYCVQSWHLSHEDQGNTCLTLESRFLI